MGTHKSLPPGVGLTGIACGDNKKQQFVNAYPALCAGIIIHSCPGFCSKRAKK
jgi:hypothetical protein